MPDSYLGMLSISFPQFSRFLPAKRLFQKIDCVVKSNPLPNPNLLPPPLSPSYSGVIRFFIKYWIFFEDTSSFNKWKSLIMDRKC